MLFPLFQTIVWWFILREVKYIEKMAQHKSGYKIKVKKVNGYEGCFKQINKQTNPKRPSSNIDSLNRSCNGCKWFNFEKIYICCGGKTHKKKARVTNELSGEWHD